MSDNNVLVDFLIISCLKFQKKKQLLRNFRYFEKISIERCRNSQPHWGVYARAKARG